MSRSSRPEPFNRKANLMGSLGKAISDVITFIPNTIASVFDSGSNQAASVAASTPEILKAPEPTSVTPMVSTESRTADIKAAEDEETKKRKAAALGRSSLVSALTLPSALGTGTPDNTMSSTTGVGTGN